MNKTVEVVAAVIEKDNKIFCTQRGPDRTLEYKWEFPGGKIEKNENHQEALYREIKEELNSEIVVKDLIITVYYEYESFNVILHTYYCDLISGNLELKEHVQSKWMNRSEIDELDWACADLPTVKILKTQIYT